MRKVLAAVLVAMAVVLALQSAPQAADPVVMSGNTVDVTAAYSADCRYNFILADTSGGAFTVTLPAVAGCIGNAITVKKITFDANAVTVAAQSGEWIEGVAASVAMATIGGTVTLFSDGMKWWEIGNTSITITTTTTTTTTA